MSLLGGRYSVVIVYVCLTRTIINHCGVSDRQTDRETSSIIKRISSELHTHTHSLYDTTRPLIGHPFRSVDDMTTSIDRGGAATLTVHSFMSGRGKGRLVVQRVGWLVVCIVPWGSKFLRVYNTLVIPMHDGGGAMCWVDP